MVRNVFRAILIATILSFSAVPVQVYAEGLDAMIWEALTEGLENTENSERSVENSENNQRSTQNTENKERSAENTEANRNAEDNKIGECRYSVDLIVRVRDELSNSARRLINSPTLDAALRLEIALSKVERVESTYGCAQTKNIFAGAKIGAINARNYRNRKWEEHRRALDSVNSIMGYGR